MAKHLDFTYRDKDYSLQFTRRTASQVEQTLVRKGLGVSKAEDSAISLQYELFKGAFLANHKTTDGRLIDEMFDQLNLEEWGPALIELYTDVYSKDDNAGEITMTKSW